MISAAALLCLAAEDCNRAEAEGALAPVTVEELQRKLAERDAIVADLARRVAALERQAAAKPAASGSTADARSNTRTDGFATADVTTPVFSPVVSAMLTVPSAPSAASGEASDGKADGKPSGPTPASGTRPEEESDEDVVDEEEITRALERTLVEEGGLLLPAGVLEVTPEFTYTRGGSSQLAIVSSNGVPVVADQDVGRNTYESSLTFRLGLPWESQAEVLVPYIFDEEETVTAQSVEETLDGSGLGDVEVALSKEFLREGIWLPSLLASARWKTTTGDANFDPSPDDLSVGSGFNAVQGTLTAVKSRDPLVFFGNASYTANLSDEKEGLDIDPGDTLSFAVGTILAAGPDTSVRFALRQDFTNEASVDGSDLAGSDEVDATFEVGAAAVLSASTLLDVATEIGLTDDSPDYVVRVSLPVRF